MPSHLRIKSALIDPENVSLPKFFSMRVVAEVPHPRFKITIFSWNEKYIIKVEISTYEQSFKIEHGNVDGGLEQVKAMIDQDFLDNCMQRFLTMRSDFESAYQRVTQ